MHETNASATTAMGLDGQKVAQNATFLLAGQVASSVVSVILTAVLGRQLGAEEFGIYYLLAVVSGFAYVFIDWGQSAYLISELVRHPERANRFLGGVLIFRVVVTLLAAPTVAALMNVIGYDSGTMLLAVLAVVCGLPSTLSLAYTYMFRARNRMDLDAIVTVTAKVLTVAVTVPVVLLGGRLTSVVLMQAMGGVGALLVAVLLARMICLKAQRPGRGVLNELGKGGTPVAVFFIAVAAHPFVDAIILSRLVPPEVVGWYGAARNIMGLLVAPVLILGSATLPELSRVSGSVPDLRHALRGTLRLVLGIGALAAAGTFLFADVAVGIIYGRGHFDHAVVVLQFFSPVLPLLLMSMLFGTAITATGKTKEMGVAKVLNVAVTAGLNVLLIPICQARFGNGGIGLVLAFGVGEVLMLIAYFWLLPRGAVDRSTLLDFLRAAATAGGTAVIIWALPAIAIWQAIPACVAVFMALALASGLVLRADLDRALYLVRATISPTVS